MTDQLRAPWEALRGEEEGLWRVYPADRHYRDDGSITTVPIATIDNSRDGHEPTRLSAESKAYLIAAAPEIREALVDLLLYLAVPDDAQDPVAVPLIRAGLAAIVKAGGRA